MLRALCYLLRIGSFLTVLFLYPCIQGHSRHAQFFLAFKTIFWNYLVIILTKLKIVQDGGYSGRAYPPPLPPPQNFGLAFWKAKCKARKLIKRLKRNHLLFITVTVTGLYPGGGVIFIKEHKGTE